jgi:FixJ family two-component response regulator
MRTVLPTLRAETGQDGPGRILVLGRAAAEDVQRSVTGQAAEIWVVDGVDELSACVDPGSWGCLVADPVPLGDGDRHMFSALLRDWPGFPLVVWSANIEVRSAVDVMQQGALQVLRNPEDEALLPSVLADALRSGREKHEAWRASCEAAKKFHQLSADERSVLALLLHGRTNKEISHQLAHSLRTVEARRQRILRTMQTENAIDLAVLLARRGLIDEALILPPQPEKRAQSASA